VSFLKVVSSLFFVRVAVLNARTLVDKAFHLS